MVSEFDITDSEFGQAFKGKHNVWHFKFNIEQEGALSVDALVDDFDLVPVIAGLTESVTINNNAFRTKDDASKNIIFKLADKKQ